MTEFEALCQVVRELRDPETGCPWDRALTHEELKPTCIEEAAEVISGINILRETGNPEGLQEELGDLLLQIVMHAQIAEEEGLFTIDDVCRTVREKMVRRHPHVFSQQTAMKQNAAERNQRSAEQNQRSSEQNQRSSEQLESAAHGLAEKPQAEQLSWDDIKRQEKAGKEWMDAYLPDAMLEARELVDRARRRKGFLPET